MRRQCEHEGKDWSYETTGQGIPAAPDSHLALEKKRNGFSATAFRESMAQLEA